MRPISASSAPGVDAEPDCARCDGLRWVSVNAPVGSDAFGTVRPCECQGEAWGAGRDDLLRRYSNLGPLSRLSFDRLQLEGRAGYAESASFRRAAQTARSFAENPAGWLVLLGPSGCGKTHLAAAVANLALAEQRPALFCPAPELIDHLRGTFEPDAETAYDDILDHVTAAPLLILDDLGLQTATPWAMEKLDQVLTHRYHGRQPTLITSSVAPDAFPERFQTRLLDPALATVCRIGSTIARPGSEVGGPNPAMLAKMTFQSFDPSPHDATPAQRETLRHVLDVARTFADVPDGWLLLVGPTGVGKTHLAVAIAGEQIARNRDVMFRFVPDLLDHLRLTFGPESRVSFDRLFDRVKNADLLILDDLGAESATAWVDEKLYQLIVHRHSARMPTVITTRLNLFHQSDDDQPMGQRDTGRQERRGSEPRFSSAIASRLRDHTVVAERYISAPDYRGGRRPTPARTRRPRGPVQGR